MKKVSRCFEENCIETTTSCSIWNGGDIESLGIQNGESLNKVVLEIVDKLEEITGDNLEDFDIDSLLQICKETAPLEVTLISILNIIKNNQVCLKDYILTLEETIQNLNVENRVKVSLQCLGDIDNLGNELGVTREQFDKLVIAKLCSHSDRIADLELELNSLLETLSGLPNQNVGEVKVSTCLDSELKPVSSQIINTSEVLCNLQDATGDPTDIASALSKTPADFNSQFGLIEGWDLTPGNLANSYGNLLLAFNNLLARVVYMEENCCAITCDSVKIGFAVTFGELGDTVVLSFLNSSGTKIPGGFVDKGSSGTITDKDGNEVEFFLGIHQDLEEEIFIGGLNTTGDLTINLNAKLGNGALTCDKCINKIVKARAGCQYCEITAVGSENSSAVIIYQTSVNDSTVVIPPVEETTTSTTTTTTAAP